ncbi:hypothetical protein Metlim_2397 [Methanoplanus limicola DSM 2279]|uniref:Uncharacterized protein n=2 Tax=Methanoplanus limicola TaxID=2315 RepID=H1Z2P5_9EURY|nr:hypothetical protein Metlim_2397 [Methanoplanus limicola DSM 2279]
MLPMKKLNRGEEVECMVIENGGRTIRRDGTMEHYGSMLFDHFLQEAYAVVTKPMLSYKKKKGCPVYLIDRDAGVTVTLERSEGEELQTMTFESTPEKPSEIIINGNKFSGWTATFERTEQVINLNTNPALVGRALSSDMLREQFSAPLSGREKLIMILVGLVAGLLLGLMF